MVDGLAWWAPSGETASLALEEILQTRDLAQGHVMLDIGANVGATSIPRVILGDFDRVFAAEPDPLNYDCLVRNVVGCGAAGLVMPDRVAIGDCDSRLPLQQETSRTHHLIPGPVPAGKQAACVSSLRLDTWVRQLDIDLIDVGFVKVDTQGWEHKVLLGAAEVLRHKHIVWQVEFNPSMLRRAGSSAAELYDLLQASFSHFIDLRGQSGPRGRPTPELQDALSHVEHRVRSYTNLLLYNSAGCVKTGAIDDRAIDDLITDRHIGSSLH